MKRILATALAALMALGMFAVGASAAWKPEPPKPACQAPILQGAYDDLTPQQQQELEDICDAAMYAVEARFYVSPWAFAHSYVSEKALIDFSKYTEYYIAWTEAYYAMDGAAWLAYYGFLYDEDALVAAYKAGTLKSQIETLGDAYNDARNAALEPVIRKYFKQEYIDFIISFAKVMELDYLIELSDLSEDEKDELIDALDALFTDEDMDDLTDYISDGKWPEAKALLDRIYAAMKPLLIAAGLLPADATPDTPSDQPSDTPQNQPAAKQWADKLPGWLGWVGNLPGWVQWIFHYVLFGWIFDIWPAK